MPLLTTVIDDKSPLIVYDTTWLPGTSWDDNLASYYYLGTFTTNNVTGGSVSLSFNGTSIWVYGANRPNHGSYVVQVDGATYSGLNGYSGNNLFQQSLFNTTVDQGTHTFTLTNTAIATGNLFVDIDMIVWQSTVGSSDDQLVAEIVQDTDSRFQYQEPAWDTTSGTLNFNLFDNNTGHVTETYNASVTFTFTRYATLTNFSAEAVTVFGTSGPYNGPYTAKLDGSNSVNYNASNANPTSYGTVIYHADNLGPGSHELVLTNLPSANGQSLSIDHAQLWTIASTTPSTATTPSSSPSSGSTASDSTQQSELSSGAIAGIVVAVVAAILGAGAAIFFYRRWKAALATYHNPYQRAPESTSAAPTGFSSSLETRSNTSFLRNDTPTQAPAGRAQQPIDIHATQYSQGVPLSSSSRDSRSIVDIVGSSTQSQVDEGLGRRPLPDVPGGGLSLAAEFPKLASTSQRVQSMMTIDATSISISEAPPPNYTQATGAASTTHPSIL